MEAWRRKKKKAEAQAAAAEMSRLEAAKPVVLDEPISSEDEELPVALTLHGKLITLSPGMLINLLPSEVSKQPEEREMIETNFLEMKEKQKRKGKAHREQEELNITKQKQKPFIWEDHKPGHRPDTLVIRGLPYEWFDLTPETLKRKKVVPGSSPLRRLLESFAIVYDIDVRPFDPEEKARVALTLTAGKKWRDRAMIAREERAKGTHPSQQGGYDITNSAPPTTVSFSETAPSSSIAEVTNDHSMNDGKNQLNINSSKEKKPNQAPEFNDDNDDHSIYSESEASAICLFENDEFDEHEDLNKEITQVKQELVENDNKGGNDTAEREIPQDHTLTQEPPPPTSPVDNTPLLNQSTPPQPAAVGSVTKSSKPMMDIIDGGQASQDMDTQAYPVEEANTFEALVQYRTYEGFLASLQGLGGKEMHFRDTSGVVSVAQLNVSVDYSGYFSKEALKIRAAGNRREIQLEARRLAALDRAHLRLEEGARETAQAARVAAVGLELRINDFENEPMEQAWIKKEPKLASLVQSAIEAMKDVRINISKFEGDVVSTLIDSAGLATAREDCRDSLSEADHRLKKAEMLFQKLRSNAKLELPTLEESLKSLGCNLFLEVLQRDWKQLNLGDKIEGRTLFAPDDAAFLGSIDNWEQECWGLHVIEVPLLISDMVNNPGGSVQPLDRVPKHALKVRIAMDGRPSIWCIGDSRPPRVSMVSKVDVKIRGGIILHVLDRILYHP